MSGKGKGKRTRAQAELEDAEPEVRTNLPPAANPDPAKRRPRAVPSGESNR